MPGPPLNRFDFVTRIVNLKKKIHTYIYIYIHPRNTTLEHILHTNINTSPTYNYQTIEHILHTYQRTAIYRKSDEIVKISWPIALLVGR